jgi:short-subunit dehydrogenase
MSLVVFISGASKGMGKATGEYLTGKGFKVYGTARHPEAYPESVFPLLKMDLEDNKSIEEAVAYVVEREGGIDVLVNNAGRGMMGPLEETSGEDLEKLFRTNVFGPLKLIKTVLPVMRKQKKGLIINITSVAGMLGLPYRGIYSASKSAMIILTETLRYELAGSGIKAVDLSPGDIATDIASDRLYAEVSEDSPYYESYKEILQATDSEVDKGLPPVEVARTVYRIIRSHKPKPRYIVAPFTQKILPVVKGILPPAWFEKLIAKHYGIK